VSLRRSTAVIGLAGSDGCGQAPPLTAREGLMLLNMVSTPGTAGRCQSGRRTVKFDDNADPMSSLFQMLGRIRLLDVNRPPGCIVLQRKLAGKCFLLSSVTRRRCCTAANVHYRCLDAGHWHEVVVPHACNLCNTGHRCGRSMVSLFALTPIYWP